MAGAAGAAACSRGGIGGRSAAFGRRCRTGCRRTCGRSRGTTRAAPEIGHVPARALELETSGRDLFAERGFAADRTLGERRI